MTYFKFHAKKNCSPNLTSLSQTSVLSFLCNACLDTEGSREPSDSIELWTYSGWSIPISKPFISCNVSDSLSHHLNVQSLQNDRNILTFETIKALLENVSLLKGWFVNPPFWWYLVVVSVYQYTITPLHCGRYEGETVLVTPADIMGKILNVKTAGSFYKFTKHLCKLVSFHHNFKGSGVGFLAWSN